MTTRIAIRTTIYMEIVADTNTFIAVALSESEKGKIIQLSEGYDLIAPDVLPFEIGNALTAIMKKTLWKIRKSNQHGRLFNRYPLI
ncbi:MAG: hypothetical protein K9K79_05465 [Desulfohalobiaceae bacterium]|nr:hypothetical protein [Desulfohalobiaceae bacterium]